MSKDVCGGPMGRGYRLAFVKIHTCVYIYMETLISHRNVYRGKEGSAQEEKEASEVGGVLSLFPIVDINSHPW